ncbi:E1 ubiquitin-activating protein uba2 [Toensbergia leucococca]|nr:E1 ubiquitin-activating protein uba2 [Toensbergia leucococca]
MARDRYPKQSLGALYGRIKQSRILLVGAGGIGCELLKNLVLTGFGEVHIVDLDTIDLSNLNRQFLFRHEHIKKSKALVAKETASKFNPHIKLEAHHANIKEPQFNVDWFQSFNIVFNALDNLDARRHVNKMCLAADVPLIESGTTGFNGQVQVIKKVCFSDKQAWYTKDFPRLHHKKYSKSAPTLYSMGEELSIYIFGTSEDDDQAFDHSEDSENAKEVENLRKESQALKQIRQSMGSDGFSRKIFEKVFKDDIDRLRSMEDMWKTRSPPTTLDFDGVSEVAREIDAASLAQQDQITWNLSENLAVFSDSLRRLSVRLEKAQSQAGDKDAPPILTFDKDDDDTLDFVAASANLRSIVFGIETRSKFDIKQMAGNIIPAIATTNAMTAGLCVLQAFKLMREDLGRARMVFLERSTARVINTDTLKPPNPNCSVCGVTQSKLVVDSARATLNDLVEDVLRLQLGYGDEFSINSEDGTLYDPDLEDNLPKKLRDLGIGSDTFLTVIDDDDDNPRVNLSLSVSEQSLPPPSQPVHLPQKPAIPRKPKPPTTTPTIPNGKESNGIAPPNGISGTRRKRSPDDEDHPDLPQSKKRTKDVPPPSSKDKDDLIVLDDSGNGAIVIEDD